MKTPRQILFERHQAVEKKLDQIRTQVLTSHLSSAVSKPAQGSVPWAVRIPWKFWRELIWRPRWVWAGFAFTWLVIVAVNLADSEPSTRTEAGVKPPPAGLFLGWDQQEKLIAELIGQAEPSPVDRPKAAAPKPRIR